MNCQNSSRLDLTPHSIVENSRDTRISSWRAGILPRLYPHFSDTRWPLFLALMLLGLTLFAGRSATAADLPVVRLVIKDHRFAPDVLEIAKSRKVKLEIKNEDAAVEEFESADLNREKLIPPGQTAIVFIGPLEPGVYTFFGEFHPETARGRIVVK